MASIQPSLTQYDILQKLGEGSFSQVYKVIRRSDKKTYAMKKIKIGSLSQKEQENALNEIRILASLETPYIVSYKEAFYDNPSHSLCIIMDIAEKGDVLKLIKDARINHQPIAEKEIWRALNHILNGLKLLHSMKIVHRDLKCANIFIGRDDCYMLGDLNVSKVAKQGLVKTQTGTPYYASPEVWIDKPYDQKCDIWSLGCIIYEMASGSPPFKANDIKGLYQKIQKGLYDQIPRHYSADLQIIIKELLQVNPQNRPNAQDLLCNPIIMRKCVGTNIITTNNRPSKQELLNTIKLPNNLNLLKNNLPKSKFQELNNSYEKRPSNPSMIRERNPSSHNLNIISSIDQMRPQRYEPPRQPLSNRNLPAPKVPKPQNILTPVSKPVPQQKVLSRQISEKKIVSRQSSEKQIVPSINSNVRVSQERPLSSRNSANQQNRYSQEKKPVSDVRRSQERPNSQKNIQQKQVPPYKPVTKVAVSISQRNEINQKNQNIVKSSQNRPPVPRPQSSRLPVQPQRQVPKPAPQVQPQKRVASARLSKDKYGNVVQEKKIVNNKPFQF